MVSRRPGRLPWCGTSRYGRALPEPAMTDCNIYQPCLSSHLAHAGMLAAFHGRLTAGSATGTCIAKGRRRCMLGPPGGHDSSGPRIRVLVLACPHLPKVDTGRCGGRRCVGACACLPHVTGAVRGRGMPVQRVGTAWQGADTVLANTPRAACQGLPPDRSPLLSVCPLSTR